jgi:hypothetical protein
MWLFAWNTSWLTFALLYVSLETKLGGDPVQGGPGRKLERRKVEAPRNRCRRARVHRH